MKFIFILFPLFILATGCGSGGDSPANPEIPGSELPPLTETQRSEVGQLSSEINTINSATASLGTNTTSRSAENLPGEGPRSLLELMSTHAQASALDKETEPPHLKGFEGKIKNAMTDGHCVMKSKNQVEPAFPSLAPGPIELDPVEIAFEIIDGKSETCPIKSAFSFSMRGTAVQTGQQAISMNFKISLLNSFELKSEELINDFSIFSSKNKVDVNLKISGNQDSMSGVGSVRGQQSFVTQTMGTIGSSIDGSISFGGAVDQFGDVPNMNVNVTLTNRLKMPDYEVAGTVVLKGVLNEANPELTPDFYINGERVSQEEFAKLIPFDVNSLVPQKGIESSDPIPGSAEGEKR